MSYSTELPRSTDSRRFLDYAWIIALLSSLIFLIIGIAFISKFMKLYYSYQTLGTLNQMHYQIQIWNTLSLIFTKLHIEVSFNKSFLIFVHVELSNSVFGIIKVQNFPDARIEVDRFRNKA